MADINTNINVNVNTNGAEEALNKVGGGLDGLQTGQTRVTQSTKALTRETHSLNDGLLKNGGAMGLLGAATGGLAMDFKDAIEAIELTGVSLKGLRGAIIATGIGALAILLLELVTNWEKWSGVIDGSTAALKSFNAQVEISNQKREESNRITNSAISSLNEELRLLQAQGAAQDVILAKQNEISAAKAKQAQVDVDAYTTQLAGINALIDKDEEYLDLKNELFNLQNGQTTLSYQELRKLIDLKEEEIAAYEAENEKFKTRKDLTDKVSAAQALLNTAINDPKVAAAQEATNKRLEKQKEATNRAKEVQNQLNDALSKMGAGVKVLEDLNNQLREITLVDLTSGYSKMKVLQDAFYKNRDALREVNTQITRYTELAKLVAPTKAQQDEYKLNLQRKEIYTENLTKVEDLIEAQKTLVDLEFEGSRAAFKSNIEIMKLSDSYDTLTKSLMAYEESMNFGDLPDVTQQFERQIDLLTIQIDLINKRADIDIKANKDKLTSVDNEWARAEENQNKMLEGRAKFQETYSRLISQGQDEEGAKEGGRIAALNELRDSSNLKDQELYKQYYELEDRKREYMKQSIQLEGEIKTQGAQRDIDIHQAVMDDAILSERAALDAKMAAQEEYHNKVQTLSSNLYGFMDQLQNEQLVKSKDLRNLLLVAQKGMEIGQIVMNTTKENSRLKMQAANYSTNAALYMGLSAALSVTDPVASASYGAAAGAYTAGAAKSVAQIPINWAIAGVGIASILATTLTSWNKSSEGGGGSSGGGAGGAAAQFNIMGASGNNQLAAEIGARQNQPVNAYVVGSDMTTQQALDRNRITNATFL